MNQTTLEQIFQRISSEKRKDLEALAENRLTSSNRPQSVGGAQTISAFGKSYYFLEPQNVQLGKITNMQQMHDLQQTINPKSPKKENQRLESSKMTMEKPYAKEIKSNEEEFDNMENDVFMEAMNEVGTNNNTNNI